MLDFIRHVNYYIVLKEPIDYFDLVPDIEKETRMRVELKILGLEMIYDKEQDMSFPKYRKIGILISCLDPDKKCTRLFDSDFYKILVKEKNWYTQKTGTNKIDSDFQLDSNETKLYNCVKAHIGDNIFDEGWYDHRFIV
jgi:hypothetical protein